jgi:adenine deaminase
MNREDMAAAANKLVEIGSGQIVITDGDVPAQIEMPALGLLAEDSLSVVTDKFDRAPRPVGRIGCPPQGRMSQLGFCVVAPAEVVPA